MVTPVPPDEQPPALTAHHDHHTVRGDPTKYYYSNTSPYTQYNYACMYGFLEKQSYTRTPSIMPFRLLPPVAPDIVFDGTKHFYGIKPYPMLSRALKIGGTSLQGLAQFLGSDIIGCSVGHFCSDVPP